MGEEHKDLVIDALSGHSTLAAVVLRKGWADDAREVLATALKTRPHYVPSEWIAAVASLRDPATYEDLLAYFIEGMNRSSTYACHTHASRDRARGCRGRGLEKAAGQFSSHRREEEPGSHCDRSRHWRCALETAFGLLVGEKWLAERARESILRHTEAVGSDEEIKAFYEEHKGRFRWDKERRKFIVERPYAGYSSAPEPPQLAKIRSRPPDRMAACRARTSSNGSAGAGPPRKRKPSR